MTKKGLNQNAKYVQELIDIIELNFIFENKPINRFEINNNIKENVDQNLDKRTMLEELKRKINSIEDCNLKDNAKNLVLGDGNINSPVMLIGETPGEIEDSSGYSYQGGVGELLKKMLAAINIEKEKIYTSYSINFRPPNDRKPTSKEIRRYSIFIKEHISIINPKIIILMGSTAMEAVTGINDKVSSEKGSWKEIILNNKTYPLIITFSPSYLIRFPDNKRSSWEDLKRIKRKIEELNIKF